MTQFVLNPFQAVYVFQLKNYNLHSPKTLHKSIVYILVGHTGHGLVLELDQAVVRVIRLTSFL